MTSVAAAVHVPAHLALPGPLQAKQLHRLHAQLTGAERPQAKKVLRLCTQGRFCRVQLFVTLWTVTCQASQGAGFSRQEYWSVLANTGCHTLLEHCISCCLSRQPLGIPGAARTPATLAAAPPPRLALTGANSSPPGQPQEQTPVDNPRAEVEIKPQLKPRGGVAKEKTQNLPTSCISCRLNPHDQLARLCVYGIHKRSLRAPTKENALVVIAVDIGGKNTQE